MKSESDQAKLRNSSLHATIREIVNRFSQSPPPLDALCICGHTWEQHDIKRPPCVCFGEVARDESCECSGFAYTTADCTAPKDPYRIAWESAKREVEALTAGLRQAQTDRDALAAEVREWLCDKCNTVYPGPPQKGFACVMCPRCGGNTGPRMSMERDALARKLAAALDPTTGADHREPGDK